MSAWAPPWDDDLPAPPDVAYVAEDTPEGEGADEAATGSWSRQYRANRPHDCERRALECPGDIGRGDLYTRTATLVRIKGRKGPGRRGTVIVTRTCQACT